MVICNRLYQISPLLDYYYFLLCHGSKPMLSKASTTKLNPSLSIFQEHLSGTKDKIYYCQYTSLWHQVHSRCSVLTWKDLAAPISRCYSTSTFTHQVFVQNPPRSSHCSGYWELRRIKYGPTLRVTYSVYLTATIATNTDFVTGTVQKILRKLSNGTVTQL